MVIRIGEAAHCVKFIRIHKIGGKDKYTDMPLHTTPSKSLLEASVNGRFQSFRYLFSTYNHYNDLQSLKHVTCGHYIESELHIIAKPWMLIQIAFMHMYMYMKSDQNEVYD